MKTSTTNGLSEKRSPVANTNAVYMSAADVAMILMARVFVDNIAMAESVIKFLPH
jgi:hypothetical protein